MLNLRGLAYSPSTETIQGSLLKFFASCAGCSLLVPNS